MCLIVDACRGVLPRQPSDKFSWITASRHRRLAGVQSTIRNLHGLGSMATNMGLVRCANEHSD
jgi:hypothetical protein